MTSDEQTALVRRLWDEGWNTGDTAIVDEIVAEDATAHGQTGRQAWKDAIVFYRRLFPDLHYEIDDIFSADGNRVVVRWTATGTDTVGLGGAPTGKRASVTGVNVYRVENGKLTDHWDEWDLAGLLGQLGLIPPLPVMP